MIIRSKSYRQHQWEKEIEKKKEKERLGKHASISSKLDECSKEKVREYDRMRKNDSKNVH